MSEQQLWAVRLQSGEYLKGGASGPWVTATKDLAGAFANTVPGRTVVPVTLIETAELDALRAALKAARDYLARDIDEILYSACRLDPVTGHPRRETIDADYACFVEDAERIIAACDAALKGGEG